MDDNLQAIIDKANSNPDYRALVEYLNARKQMPSMSIEDLSDNMGIYRPRSNHIGLDRTSGANPENLLHETTHAADTVMANHYKELQAKQDRNQYENQFVDSYGKMGSERELTDPEWFDQQRRYRTSNMEMPAHAIQNMNSPERNWQAPGHLDATKASEFMMLLEQAKRAQSPPGFLQRMFR